jgi:predicted ArsR family transcriptional regulator
VQYVEQDIGEASTRARVARVVLLHGPVTASQIAGRLGITPAAVRRHLDKLLAEGLVTSRDARPYGPRGRGRPARQFVVTNTGQATMNAAYDDLATSALRYLSQRDGRQAVEEFARSRVADLERRYAPTVEEAGGDLRRRTSALAEALSDDGYAATARPVAEGTPLAATQLCQGHCPVQHVAREFPELCEAETEAFSRLLGVHVQRLATLANGAHVCTTHVPVAVPAAGGTPPGADTLTRTDEHDSPKGRNC